MILRDFRETIADELRDPTFQREYLNAMFEEGGAEGVLQAVQEIAIANDDASPIAVTEEAAGASLHRSASRKGNPSFKRVRAALNALDLDFAVVSRKGL